MHGRPHLSLLLSLSLGWLRIPWTSRCWGRSSRSASGSPPVPLLRPLVPSPHWRPTQRPPLSAVRSWSFWTRVLVAGAWPPWRPEWRAWRLVTFSLVTVLHLSQDQFRQQLWRIQSHIRNAQFTQWDWHAVVFLLFFHCKKLMVSWAWRKKVCHSYALLLCVNTLTIQYCSSSWEYGFFASWQWDILLLYGTKEIMDYTVALSCFFICYIPL